MLEGVAFMSTTTPCHTHTHTQTHTLSHTRMAQQPPAHAHLHTQEQLHSGLDGIKAAQGRDSSWLETQPESEPEPVHCADLQRNEICFIMQNANTPPPRLPTLVHSYIQWVWAQCVCTHYTYATCGAAVPQKMSSADDCENAHTQEQVMS